MTLKFVPTGRAITECEKGEQAALPRVCRLCRRKRRGAAAVEFALVAPIFFLTVLGMIEVGRAVMVQQVLVNASREGARRAVLDGATATNVTSFVTTYLNGAAIYGATISYPQGNPESAGYGAPVEVKVLIPFSQVSWVPAPMYLKGANLSASTVMRRETAQ
jgi:hypothetical protein